MKKTSKQLVNENITILQAMTTCRELHQWAKANGCDSASGFSAFKKALLAAGIDYDGVKNAAKDSLAGQVTHDITLYSDAKASHGRFGICGADGNVVWHGRFFAEDNAREQSDAELEAAKKAVWMASKIKEAAGAKVAKLTLLVDAQWLVYQDNSKQKGFVLTQLATRFGLVLDVQWIPGTDNPADEWTVASGYKKWSDNDLKSMATPVVSEDKPSPFTASAATMAVATTVAAIGMQLSLF